MDDVYIKGIFGLAGIILGSLLTYFLKENKISLETRMKIIHESLDSMKDLLSNMSNAKNKVAILLQDIESSNKVDTKIHKEAVEAIQKCIDNFNENRGGLYIFIAKDESPLFIDYTVVLINLISVINNYEDFLKYQKQIKNSYNLFITLYSEYNDNYTKMIDITINKKQFH